MKQVVLLLAFFGFVTISSVSGQNQKSTQLQQEKTTTIAQSIAAKKAVSQASIVKEVSSHASKRESFSKVQYCSKSGKAVSSGSSWNSGCIKSKANCDDRSSTAKSAALKSRTDSCSPAQRAACTSANTKSAALKKAQKSKA